MGYIFIVLKIFILLPTILNQEGSFLERNISSKSLNLLNILLPYRFIKEYNLGYCLLITGISLLLLVFIGVGMRNIYKDIWGETFQKFFIFFLYFFEYIMVLQILGFLVQFFVVDKDLSGSFNIIFTVVFLIIIGIYTSIMIFLSLFLFNFYINLKDPLARNPNIFHFFLKIGTLLIMLLDLFYSDKNSKLSLLIIANLVYSIILTIDVVIRLPYYNYNVNI